ncbi:hypothetical protein [Candidatus Lokiarchaeum ossiferum]|uniref:hypothetical protein n=1 Tax=Candidatus Lokiarchaeum ossiferum TaxID=2951803 RepID=UPI00352DA150
MPYFKSRAGPTGGPIPMPGISFDRIGFRMGLACLFTNYAISWMNRKKWRVNPFFAML